MSGGWIDLYPLPIHVLYCNLQFIQFSFYSCITFHSSDFPSQEEAFLVKVGILNDIFRFPLHKTKFSTRLSFLNLTKMYAFEKEKNLIYLSVHTCMENLYDRKRVIQNPFSYSCQISLSTFWREKNWKKKLYNLYQSASNVIIYGVRY